jgi:hypothetical protein
MTEYSKLIEDLLVNGLGYGFQVADLTQRAAKALKAQAKEIAEKDARIAELEAALTPLAEMDYWIEPHHYAHDSIEQCNQLTVAEILAARAALNGERKNG